MKTVPSLLALALAAPLAVAAAPFGVTSPDLTAGGTMPQAQVYRGMGCEGGNVSPQLAWHNAPAGTRSFAVTVYDPDAPTGSGWWHWTVFNLPASATGLARGAGNPGGKLPAGAVQGRTDFGSSGYGGACPPVGDKPHRYQVTVWALKTDKLPLGHTAGGAQVGFLLNANVLARAQLTVTYGR